MSANHTPGPWFIHETLGHAVCCVGRVRIAADKMPTSNAEADVRLIAAAPDLLEALKKAAAHIEAMMAHIEHKPERFKAHCFQQALDARAAIAKASGSAA